jgi:hypothetical protein
VPSKKKYQVGTAGQNTDINRSDNGLFHLLCFSRGLKKKTYQSVKNKLIITKPVFSPSSLLSQLPFLLQPFIWLVCMVKSCAVGVYGRVLCGW